MPSMGESITSNLVLSSPACPLAQPPSPPWKLLPPVDHPAPEPCLAHSAGGFFVAKDKHGIWMTCVLCEPGQCELLETLAIMRQHLPP